MLNPCVSPGPSRSDCVLSAYLLSIKKDARPWLLKETAQYKLHLPLLSGTKPVGFFPKPILPFFTREAS